MPMSRPHRPQAEGRQPAPLQALLARIWRLLLSLLLVLNPFGVGLFGGAQARTVKIISADRLELRKLAGSLQADGSTSADQEIVVISGEKVELHIDQDVVMATRVEYNRTRRTLTLVGKGEYDNNQNGSSQILKGTGLVVDLGTQALTGEDVIMSDASLEIRGEAVSRVPGKLTASKSYFTPCGRCGRTPNDYAFRAKNVQLYPGDRLVAYDATLLLADTPVLFLPIVVLPLNDQARQPRINFGQDAIDGFTAQADLPFVIGDKTVGTTLLRYYNNRSPRIGFGVDLHSYAPLRGVEKVDLYAFSNPRPLTAVRNADGSTSQVSSGESDYDLNFSVKGRFDLGSSTIGVPYTLTAVRNDVGRSDSDPQRGVTDLNGTASAEFPSTEFGSIGVQLNYTGRVGPAPTVALPNVLRSEVIIDPKVYRMGNLSADFKVTLGRYTGQSNSLSRSAQRQGPNFTTARLEETHDITYTTKPWANGDFTFNNIFTGRYYLTGARTVTLGFSAALTQTFAAGNTFKLAYAYNRAEGTSPFAFDAVSVRDPSGILSADATITPAKGFTASASQTYDYVQPPEKQPAANLAVNLNKEPVSFSLNLRPNFFKGELESGSVDVTVGQNRPVLVGLRAGYNTLSGGPLPVTLSADVIGTPRTNTFGVTLNYDPKAVALSSVSFRASAASTRDMVVNPVSLTASETINFETRVPSTATPPGPPVVNQQFSASGNETLTLRGLNFTSNHSLTLTDKGSSSDNVYFGVANQSGSNTSWSLRYGGSYDMSRGGFTSPTLTGNLSATMQDRRLSVQATLSTPGLDNAVTELTSANLAGSYDLGRAYLSGGAYYTRSRQNTGTPAQSVTDTVQFQPLTLTVGLGNGPKPGAYLSAILRQTLNWKDGVLQEPGRITPILLLTVDRCCWAFQVEINPVDGRYRVGVNLPGQNNTIPAFDATSNGPSVPLLTPGK